MCGSIENEPAMNSLSRWSAQQRQRSKERLNQLFRGEGVYDLDIARVLRDKSVASPLDRLLAAGRRRNATGFCSSNPRRLSVGES